MGEGRISYLGKLAGSHNFIYNRVSPVLIQTIDAGKGFALALIADISPLPILGPPSYHNERLPQI